MTTRDLRLDTLRGLFLVIMTVDHLGSKTSEFTFQPLGFVSAAAAFVMLSGYMNAYTTPAGETGFGPLMRLAWKRAVRVYRYHIALLFVLMLAALAVTPLAWIPKMVFPEGGGAASALAYGVVLLHQPFIMDILPMYFLFLMVSPLLLAALHRGRDWWVIGLSLALWLGGQFADPLDWLSTHIEGGLRPGAFNVFAWQLIWVVGLYTGFVHRVRRRTDFFRHPACICIALAVAAGFFLARHELLPMSQGMLAYLEKENLRVLRVANIASQVVLFFCVIRLIPRQGGLPWFRFLGRYALQVFCFHVLLVYLLQPVSWRVEAWYGYTANFLYSALVLLMLTLPALAYRAYERELAASGERTWMRKARAMVRAVCNPLAWVRPVPAMSTARR